MNKTRITAIVTVTKKVELDINYSLNPNNQRQMDTLKDLLEEKFHLNTNVVTKDIDIIDILPIGSVEPERKE